MRRLGANSAQAVEVSNGMLRALYAATGANMKAVLDVPGIIHNTDEAVAAYLVLNNRTHANLCVISAWHRNSTAEQVRMLEAQLLVSWLMHISNELQRVTTSDMHMLTRLQQEYDAGRLGGLTNELRYLLLVSHPHLARHFSHQQAVLTKLLEGIDVADLDNIRRRCEQGTHASKGEGERRRCVYMYACMCTCTCMCMRVCVCLHMYLYVYVHK